MFTTVAFSESVDQGGVMSPIAAVADMHVRTQGDYIVTNEYNKLLGAYACVGATATRARLVSPSLRKVNPYCVRPLELAITPAGRPVHGVNPSLAVQLDSEEELSAEHNGNPAAAEQTSIAVWLSSGAVQPVTGKIYTIYFTITLAQLAGAWAFSEITFIDQLPVGTYTIVGAEFVIAGGVVARFVPKGGTNRPGVPIVAASNFGIDNTFRYGNMGAFTTFKTLTPPGVEVLSSAAAVSATYDCYMDVIPG